MKKTAAQQWVIGLDEVGRGALAGPVVVVAAMALVKNSCEHCEDGSLKDSKKLSPKQREAWRAHFKNHPNITYAIGTAGPRAIEKLNISGAANLAAHRAYRKLISRHPSRSLHSKTYLDGGLHLKNRLTQAADYPHAKTIVKADETIPVVSIASIIAKTHRDAHLGKLAKKYPSYGFEIHKGYGTKLHYSKLKMHGACPAHRKTFLRNA